MSQFTPLVRRTYDFQNDKVNVAFKRLQRKHVLGFMPKVQAAQKAKGDAALNAQNEMVNDLIDLLPEYVMEFDGLKDDNGDKIEFNTVVNEMYFIDLVTNIGMDLMNESVVMDGPEGKNE